MSVSVYVLISLGTEHVEVPNCRCVAFAELPGRRAGAPSPVLNPFRVLDTLEVWTKGCALGYLRLTPPGLWLLSERAK
jgi:hypothetical protein